MLSPRNMNFGSFGSIPSRPSFLLGFAIFSFGMIIILANIFEIFF